MPATGIEIDGHVAFSRALKKLDPELSKQLKEDLKAVAEVVATDARQRVPSKSGRARGSIRAGADNKGPYVAGGKKAVPYYGWLDFGSRKPVKGNPRSEGPWSKSGPGPARGRFIYAAIDANEDEILDAAVAAFTKARDAAGLGET
jgi:hypothetical protein